MAGNARLNLKFDVFSIGRQNYFDFPGIPCLSRKGAQSQAWINEKWDVAYQELALLFPTAYAVGRGG